MKKEEEKILLSKILAASDKLSDSPKANYIHVDMETIKKVMDTNNLSESEAILLIESFLKSNI